MRRSRRSPAVLAAAVVVSLLVMGACASSKSIQRADAYADQGDWDAAITYYQQALEANPGDDEARHKLRLAKVNASQMHRAQGNRLRRRGGLENLQRAELELELAARLDPTNEQAMVDLREAREELGELTAARRARRTGVEQAVDRARQAHLPVPELEPASGQSMTFDFRRAKIKEIYRSIARLGDLNVLFDPNLSNPQTSFFLEDVTLERALDVLTSTHGHFYKVLSPKTFLVADDNQNKRRQYSDQILRTFYLSNAGAESVANTIRTILQARLVQEDADLNAITIRDTPQVVEIAETLIDRLDKARGEVLLNIEVFEINRSVLNQYGLSLSDFSTVGSIAQTERGISVEELGDLTNSDVFVTIPSVRYQFLRDTSDFKQIASPQLRASDGETSSLLVGEERPVTTTTFNPQNTSGGDIIPISTTEYREVGIVINTQPTVHHDGQITLQLELEVSAVVGNAGDQQLPIFSTRRLSTTLRLMEGETNLLAGLLRDDERTVLRGFPVLSQVPILRSLFSQTEKQVQQTDIVLSITPHIVRMPDITDVDLESVYVGTEANVGGGGGVAGGGRGGAAGRGRDGDGGADEGTASPIRVELVPANMSAGVGQQFTVQVQVSGAGDINNAGMRLSFDPSVIRYVEAREGNLLGSDGARTSFQAAAGGANSVAFGIGRIGDVGGVAAAGMLAEVTFEAVAEGTSAIEITSASVRGPDGRPLPAEFSPATVEVR